MRNGRAAAEKEIGSLRLDELQPSQFYVNERKLAEVERLIREEGISGIPPIPVRILDGVPVMTDGHTRAAAALRAGWDRFPLVPEEDELGWDLYRTCVAECRRRRVLTPSDLLGRIIPEQEYREKWDGWCDLVKEPPLCLELTDGEWPFTYTDHDRLVARAIVADSDGMLYFVRADRDDDFGKAVVIETSGGGVETERGEAPREAVLREIREELGINAEIICELGTVSDYYNLIHRHNLNCYYLCRVCSFGGKRLTDDERSVFHLSTLKLSFGEAVREYEARACTRLGRLIANRELPILRRAGEILGGQV